MLRNLTIYTCLIVALLGTSSFSKSSPENQVYIESATVIAKMPQPYHGTWSPTLDLCDSDTGDSSKWLFVGADSIGSFEHMYPYISVDLGEDRVIYSTQASGGGRLSLKSVEHLQFMLEDREPLDLYRCPNESEN